MMSKKGEIFTRDLGAPYRKSIHPQKVRAEQITMFVVSNLTILLVAPPLKPAPGLKHETIILDGGKVLLENDAAVTMSDDIRLYVDIYCQSQMSPQRHQQLCSLLLLGSTELSHARSFRTWMSISESSLSMLTGNCLIL